MISSLNNPIVKHLTKLRKDRTYREECERVLVPGEILIEEISRISPPIRILSSSPLKKAIEAGAFDLTTPEIVKKITGLEAFEGACAEFHLPKPSSLKGKNWILVIDGIADPGNLGTLIRTASAFSWEGLFLLPGSVDPFNEKTLRASKGAIFHLPYCMGSYGELQELAEKENIFVADTQGEAFDAIAAPQKGILVLSNEARGPSEEILRLGKQITIPISHKTESLNVSIAGGILLYFLRRCAL